MKDGSVRIFVSSPADVEHERAIVKDILERLAAEFLPYFRVEPILWEDEALTADQTFQAGMVRPSDCDIVLVVLWTRLGSPLPQNPYQGRTGTEWEFFDAVEASEGSASPEVLVYKKTNPKLVDITNPQQTLQALEERKRLEEFFQRNFFNEDQSFRRAFRTFDSDSAFRNLVEVQLRKLLNRRIFVERRGPGRAFEWSGNPFRARAPFAFGDERIFTGREGETRELLVLLQEQLRRPEAFLLISGPSGSGKTSLVQSGLLPRLVRPHQVPGVAACRWSLVRPSPESDPLGDLARALCAPEALGDRLQDAEVDPDRLRRGLKADPDLAMGQVRSALHALTRAYRDDTGESDVSVRLALVVDPLESLLGGEVDGGFFAALEVLARCGAVWVIAVMRSDRLPDLERAGSLRDLVREGSWYAIEPIPAARSRQVIEIPALVAGLNFDGEARQRLPELLEAQTAETRLWAPLVEGTLERLFWGQLRRKSKALDSAGLPQAPGMERDEGMVEATAQGLQALGGLEGEALRRADQVWADCGEKVRGALPRLCRALIGLESRSSRRPTARVADLALLESEPASRELVRGLIDARVLVAEGERDPALLAPCEVGDYSWRGWLGRALRGARAGRAGRREGGWGGGNDEASVSGAPAQESRKQALDWREYRRTVTLVHPGLMDSWRPMADWLARPENREELVLRGQIARQARLWRRTDCNQEYLLGESGFAAAKRFEAAYADELEPAERELVAQSESYLRAQRRGRRLARATVLVLVSLLALATISALWALDASRTATKNLHRSRLKAADLAINRGNTPEAVVLALDAAPHLPLDAANTLSRALTGSHLVALAHEGPPLIGLPLSAAVDDGGERLVTADPSLGVRAWRLEGQRFTPEGSAEGAELGIHLVLFAGSGSGGTFLGVAPDGVWRLPLTGRDEPDFPCGAERGGLHAVTPDGSRLALSYALSPDEDALCVLDLQRPGEIAFDRAPHEGEIRSLAFSRGGDRLVTAGRDGLIKVLDPADGRTLLSLPSGGPLRRLINRAVFDPRGERIAVAASDHRLRIYGPDGSLSRELGEIGQGGAARRVHESEIRDVAFTPDGRFLVAADDDGQVVRWGIGGEPSVFVLGHHEDTVDRLLMAPDGARVLTISRDGTARVWELASGRQTAVFSHNGAVSDAAFTAGGRRVLTESAEDGSARLWDMAPVPRLARFLPHGGHVRHVAFSDSIDGSSLRLATTSSSGLVKVWHVDTDSLQAVGDSAMVLSGHSSGVRHLAFSADGNRLATAGQDGTARIWDVSAGEVPTRAICAMAAAEEGSAVDEALFDPSPQPRWLASVASSGERPLRLWDPDTCAPIRVEALEQVSGAGILSAEVRRLGDGALLAVGSEDGRVRVFFSGDDGSWRTLCDLRQHTRAVLDLDISSDGSLLASASEDRWARVLALQGCGDGNASVDLIGHSDAVHSVRFSADGRRLVSASLDGTARVWDASSGAEIAVLRDHNNRVYYAEFGVDDRFVLTASRDGAVRVWQNPPGSAPRHPRALLVYSADLGGVPHAAFGPRGQFIAAGYWRDAAAVWKLLETAGEGIVEPADRRAEWGAALEDLALIDAAWRFRSENRLDELLEVAPAAD